MNITEHISAVAKKNPHKTAVIYLEHKLTYAELEQAANNIRQTLIDNGVTQQQAIGIYLERSHWLIASILAVLKHGCSYIPLDLNHPQQRTQFILEDASLHYVITQKQYADLPNHVQQIVPSFSKAPALQTLPAIAGTADMPAYSIYTSGTTGVPKGVNVSQHNLLRLFTSTEKLFAFKADDVWCMFHSPSFDFSVWEIFGALFYGATLVVVPNQISQQTGEFYNFVSHHNISVLNQTPSAFYQFIANDQLQHKTTSAAPLQHLRYIIFGGEGLIASKLIPWKKHHPLNKTQLVNMYGITETTVHVTYKVLSDADIEYSHDCNIGRALPDLNIYLQDEQGNLINDQREGEILVTGEGLSLGYHNRPLLNQERFIFLDLAEGKTTSTPSNSACIRAYKSGDLALRLDNGDFIYRGRKDRQVKVRGYRIELGEIEAHIDRHAFVNQSAVIAHQYSDEDTRLIAFIVPEKAQEIAAFTHADAQIALNTHKHFATSIKDFIKTTLADYMVPGELFFIRQLPLNANHKADTEKLKTYLTTYHQQTPLSQALQSALEQTLLELWQQLLKTQVISRNSQFHEVGGHSLLAAQLLTKIQARWGITIKMEQLKNDFSIARLAEIINQA